MRTLKAAKVVLLVLLIGLASISGADAAAKAVKMAVVFPGSIQDADYNAIGYTTMQNVQKQLGLEVAYSEKVAVPDAARVLREYADAGYQIIWAHGAQFNNAVFQVAKEYPKTCFIIEEDSPLKESIPNIILLERNYYLGFYVLGVLASKLTTTNHIGYVGGLQLPFTYGEINAINQARREYNPKAEFHYIYVGDFNDPLKSRQAAETLISKKCDVIISGVNLGNYGLFKAVENADRHVWVTTTYTDKHSLAPKHHVTSDLFFYDPPVFKAIEMVKNGKPSGHISMEFGEGKARYIKFPLDNVSEQLNAEIKAIAEKVASGEIKVIKNLSTLEID